MSKGDILECVADCPSFEADVKGWCQRTHKTLIVMRDDGNAKRCQVRI